jgi:hypothetical protein
MLDSIIADIIKEHGYSDFSIYRSEICHMLKFRGDNKFFTVATEENWVLHFWDNGMYAEAFYICALLEYLATILDVDYIVPEKIKGNKLKYLLYPTGIIFMDTILPSSRAKEKAILECQDDECGKYFFKYNIIEKDIRDVV